MIVCDSCKEHIKDGIKNYQIRVIKADSNLNDIDYNYDFCIKCFHQFKTKLNLFLTDFLNPPQVKK